MLTWREVIEAENANDRREIGSMCSGITVLRQGRALILLMPNGGFRCLSSGFPNGGYMDSPQAVVNVTGIGGKVEYTCMTGGLEEFDEYSLTYVRKLGLDAAKTVCMSTAAHMDNAVVRTMTSMDGISVSLAVTAGIRNNAGRSGDPASFDEAMAVYPPVSGTIIIMASIAADLSDAALFEAMMILTEAKSCVIQELQAHSKYSRGIATGSGTDQVAVLTDKGSPNKVESIAKNSHLAHTISECLKETLMEAFDRQSDMNPKTQCDPLIMLGRYDLDMDIMGEEIRFPATRAECLSALEELRRDRCLASTFNAIMRIGDDVRNGLIPAEDGLRTSIGICKASILTEVDDEVVRMRIDSSEDIRDLMSYVFALKLLETVERRRSADVH